MSYILDALRKSESERQREASTGIARAPIASSRQHMPLWAWALIVLLSLALVALAAAWWQSALFAPAVPSNAAPLPAPVSTIGPQEVAPAVAAAEPAIDPGGPVDLTPAPIGRIRELDPNLPEFRLEFLAYNGQDPAESSVWINGRRYFTGELLTDGPEVVEIRADSVILSYRGRRYLLTTR